MADRSKGEYSKLVKNPLLSGAGAGFPFDNFSGSSLLVPVARETPPVLLEDVGEVDTFVGQEAPETEQAPTEDFKSVLDRPSSAAQKYTKLISSLLWSAEEDAPVKSGQSDVKLPDNQSSVSSTPRSHSPYVHVPSVLSYSPALFVPEEKPTESTLVTATALQSLPTLVPSKTPADYLPSAATCNFVPPQPSTVYFSNVSSNEPFQKETSSHDSILLQPPPPSAPLFTPVSLVSSTETAESTSSSNDSIIADLQTKFSTTGISSGIPLDESSKAPYDRQDIHPFFTTKIGESSSNPQDYFVSDSAKRTHPPEISHGYQQSFGVIGQPMQYKAPEEHEHSVTPAVYGVPLQGFGQLPSSIAGNSSNETSDGENLATKSFYQNLNLSQDVKAGETQLNRADDVADKTELQEKDLKPNYFSYLSGSSETHPSIFTPGIRTFYEQPSVSAKGDSSALSSKTQLPSSVELPPVSELAPSVPLSAKTIPLTAEKSSTDFTVPPSAAPINQQHYLESNLISSPASVSSPLTNVGQTLTSAAPQHKAPPTATSNYRLGNQRRPVYAPVPGLASSNLQASPFLQQPIYSTSPATLFNPLAAAATAPAPATGPTQPENPVLPPFDPPIFNPSTAVDQSLVKPPQSSHPPPVFSPLPPTNLQSAPNLQVSSPPPSTFAGPSPAVPSLPHSIFNPSNPANPQTAPTTFENPRQTSNTSFVNPSIPVYHQPIPAPFDNPPLSSAQSFFSSASASNQFPSQQRPSQSDILALSSPVPSLFAPPCEPVQQQLPNPIPAQAPPLAHSNLFSPLNPPPSQESSSSSSFFTPTQNFTSPASFYNPLQPSSSTAPESSAMTSPSTDPAMLNTIDLSAPSPGRRSPSPSVVPQRLLNLGQSGIIYRPPYFHWFWNNDVDENECWQPFSMSDSLELEQAYNSESLTIETVVPTDGGRYDVAIVSRRREAVYWKERSWDVRRCSWFHHYSTEARTRPYDENTAAILEEEYKAAVTSGSWNRRVQIDDAGAHVIMYGPSSLAHYDMEQPSPDAWEATTDLGSQSKKRAQIVKRGVEDVDIDEGETPTIDHLVFVVHGIGPICDLKFRTIEQAVSEFRTIAQQLTRTHYPSAIDRGEVNRIELLPVSWHRNLHRDGGVDDKLKKITLKTIPKLREFTNETLLDILFYTSPTYCQNICQQVVQEINRLYDLFLKRNPSFQGHISLTGHSLGSLILFDTLCHQKRRDESSTASSSQSLAEDCLTDERNRTLTRTGSYVIGPAGTGQPFITYPQFKFHPNSLFALGSPIGMFVTVRGIDSLGLDFRLPTCPGFYNIFHPCDPVAYRIEALINPEFANLRPVLIPHHKGRKRMHLELRETMARIGADFKQRLIDSMKTTWNTVNQIAMFGRNYEILEQEVQEADRTRTESVSDDEAAAAATGINAGVINQGRRVDYVLQEAPFESFNEYLSAIISHVCYWKSEDTVLFILKDIYNNMGVIADTPAAMADEPVTVVSPPPQQQPTLSSPSAPIGMDPTAPMSSTSTNFPPPPMAGFVRK